MKANIKVAKLTRAKKRPNLIYVICARENMTPSPCIMPTQARTHIDVLTLMFNSNGYKAGPMQSVSCNNSPLNRTSS